MVLIDKSLAWKRESHTASFTLLMWNLDKDTLIAELKHKLALISTIKNQFRKIKLNDRLYEYLVSIEKSSNQSYSQIVLIGSETYILKLDSKDINMLKEYSIPQFNIQNDEFFNIKWLTDLFENFKFYDVILNDQKTNKLTHMQGNMGKKKIIKQNVGLEYIKNLNTNWFMVGKLSSEYKTKYLVEHWTNSSNSSNSSNNMSWIDIIEKIEILEMKKKIDILDKHFEAIVVNSDKYIFGFDVYEMIYQYNIKELFIHKKVIEDFNNKIIEKDLSSNLNFNIIEINSFDDDQSNSSNIFLKNYSGILGIKYY
jgi:hypothetical protein